MAKQHDKQFKLDAIQYYEDHKDLGVREVILVINGKAIPNAPKLIEMLDEAIYNVPVYEDGPLAGVEFNLESVIVNINKSKNLEGQILGEECITIAGKPTITEEVGGLSFEISPLSFYHRNSGTDL